MSYKIIARQWRPKGFEELIGQDALKDTLMNALRLNRLPHALLFSGQRGTGKTSMARIIAKSLRCLSPSVQSAVQSSAVQSAVQSSIESSTRGISKTENHQLGRSNPSGSIEPCQECGECLEIQRGINPNALEIDGASNTGVDSVRELTNNVSYTPSIGRYKIYIIDEVHMLSTSAFNALLKTLEEPPAHVYFILVTTEVHKIPITILSRCQRFEFRKIPAQIIFNQLKYILKKEKISSDSKVLWQIAHHADGSLRDAQILLDQLISYSPLSDIKRNSAINNGAISSSAIRDDGIREEPIQDKVCQAHVTQLNMQQEKKNGLSKEVLGEKKEKEQKQKLKNISDLKEKGRSTLTLKKASQMLGLTDRNLLFETLTCILNQNIGELLKLIEKIHLKGSDPGEFIKDLLKECRNLLMVKVFLKNFPINYSEHSEHSEEKALFEFENSFLFDFSKEEMLKLKSLSQNILEEDIHFLFDLLLKGSQDVLSSRDTRTTLEMLLLRAAQVFRLESLKSWMGGSLPSKSKETKIFFHPEKRNP